MMYSYNTEEVVVRIVYCISKNKIWIMEEGQRSRRITTKRMANPSSAYICKLHTIYYESTGI